jgi:Na+/H+ antiporter NhaC
MSPHFGVLSILPPLLAVGLAVWRKQLLPAIFLGIIAGETILAKGNPAAALIRSFDDSLSILEDRVNLQIVLFSLLAGGLLKLIHEARGFQGLIDWFEKKNIVGGKKAVYPLTYLLNVILFVDSWSSILITGFVTRSIYTKLRISRERLAYFLHTTALNFVALILINCWGAYYLSLLRAQNVSDAMGIMVGSIPFNFYCLGSLILVAIVMATDLSLGPMKAYELRAERPAQPAGAFQADVPGQTEGRRAGLPPRASFVVLPVLLLVVCVFTGLFITGDGNLMKGSGAASLFYAVSITLLASCVFFIGRRVFRLPEAIDVVFKGMADLLPVGGLLVLAMTIGYVCRQVGTGPYLAEVIKHGLPAFTVPALVFGLSCLISFATGTCWGTLAIMVPIAMPISAAVGGSPSLMFGACVGGGVFGNNCSPIADTSILAAMAAEVNVVDHVRTQIPYALLVATGSFVLYLVFGLVR